MPSVLIAFVGKPSAGKSSFLNAVTDAAAKVGNYPFTTIEPNHGVAFHTVECPCKRFDKMDQCQPRYGKCEQGKRYVPVQMMDVAGLIPGASEGLGLGNKFLDDLRHAHVLIHVVDVSGTTNEKGEATTGYDPTNDIEWLYNEICAWILSNLENKWSTVARKFVTTKAPPTDLLQNFMSGYGSTHVLMARIVDAFVEREKNRLLNADPEKSTNAAILALDRWTKEDRKRFVDVFMEIRFPTVVALNKIDMMDADRNIMKISRKYNAETLVFTSALAECFLRKMQKQGYIYYVDGTDAVYVAGDPDAEGMNLRPLDEKGRRRLDNIKDSVLFRYGGTGVQEAINRAVSLLGMIPVYTVKNINNFLCDGNSRSGKVFRDVELAYPKTTVREFAKCISSELDEYYAGAETVGGIQLAEKDEITYANNIICYKMSKLEDRSSSSSSSKELH